MESVGFCIPTAVVVRETYVLASPLGMTRRQRLVIVAHSDPGSHIRIISARIADRDERQVYEEGQP